MRTATERAYETYQQINSSIQYARIAQSSLPPYEDMRKELIGYAIGILEMVAKDINQNDLMAFEPGVKKQNSKKR